MSSVVEPDAKQSPHKDIHHDPWLIPVSDGLISLAETIFHHLEANCPRPARQRSDAMERRKAIVENLTGSLGLLVHHHPEGSRLAVSARKDASTRYDRKGFSPKLFVQVIEEMERCGFIVIERGTRGKFRTTAEPTALLRGKLYGTDVRVGRRDGAETIILKAKDGRVKPKVLIDYKDTAETEAMRADMESVNAFLQASDIRKAGEPPPSPVFMTRRFQIGHKTAPHTFDQHGRLYGPFWLSMSKTERHLLRVDGEPVIDLDFSAMYPRLAYLHAGLALPNSDPYEIEGLPRDAAKVAFSALLSRSGPMKRLPKELAALVDGSWTPAVITGAFEDRHPGIAHLYGTGIGLRLAKTEADILMETLLGLFAKGVPALGMHDGLMVPASKAEIAMQEMRRASLKVVGASLPISQKEIWRPDS